MPERIPQSVAKLVVFRAIASADHYTPATAKTIAITISKNGATSFSNPNAGATNATEMASGFYKFTLDTTDTGTKGPLAWRGAGTGIDDAGDVYEVVNATNAGFTSLPDTACTTNASLITAGTGTSQLSVSSGAVIVQAGSGTGQLDFTSGVIKANVTQFGGSNGTFASGRPEVNTSHFGGTAGTFSSGRPEVNTTHAAGTAWGSGAITSGALAAGALTAIENKIWDATTSSHTTAGSFGGSFAALYSGTCSSGSTSTAVLPSGGGISSTDNYYKDDLLYVLSGTGAGLWAYVQSYNGTTRTFTLDRTLVTALDNTSVIAVYADGGVRALDIADTLLKRDMSAVSGEAARSPLNAFRFIRNKWSISGTTLTVTKEDDATSAWTSTLTATNGADPITASDPA